LPMEPHPMMSRRMALRTRIALLDFLARPSKAF